MAAKQDFPTVKEQKLTHSFLNAIPQWNTINRNGSIWYSLEKQTRQDALKRDLRITIGTLGIMSLRGKEIYLDYDAKKIPVPRYIYKIITDEKDTKVYVFFNNPYIEEADVRKEMNAIFGDKIVHLPDKPGTGCTFTTTYEDFREKTNSYFKGFELPEVAQKPTPQNTEAKNNDTDKTGSDAKPKTDIDIDDDIVMQ